MRAAFFDIIKTRGIQGLYAGLSPTLVEIIPYAGLQFGTYDTFKRWMMAWNKSRFSHLSSIRPDDSPSSFQLFLCGFAAGTCAKAVCHPLDVVKKRFQVTSSIPEAKYPDVEIIQVQSSSNSNSRSGKYMIIAVLHDVSVYTLMANCLVDKDVLEIEMLDYLCKNIRWVAGQEMKPEELETLKKDMMSKRKVLSLVVGPKKVKAAVEMIPVSTFAMIELSHYTMVFANTVRVAWSELAEVRKRADAKIGHLKEVLARMEAEKAKAEAMR
ncbi:hypothetical protein COCNU_04G009720 [Cocos nucifera]|uniref:Uncharacterized protein n=1 Tax=Cocos nucifera TaxID=13894 RepID=A0A8K0I6B2_COCNU|nr:hypothetical protein COCNU_04G009720 [Cocos nucifera]